MTVPQHLLLKYHGSDTVEKHRTILEKHGGAWWGQRGRHMSREVLQAFREQIAGGTPTYVYFYSSERAQVTHRGTLIDVRSARLDRQTPSGGLRIEDEPELVPTYYRGQIAATWLKLGSLEASDSEILQSLRTGSEVRPKLASQANFMYVHHAGPATQGA